MSEQFLELTWKLIFSKVTFFITSIAGAKVESPRKKMGKSNIEVFVVKFPQLFSSSFPYYKSVLPSILQSIPPDQWAL